MRRVIDRYGCRIIGTKSRIINWPDSCGDGITVGASASAVVVTSDQQYRTSKAQMLKHRRYLMESKHMAPPCLHWPVQLSREFEPTMNSREPFSSNSSVRSSFAAPVASVWLEVSRKLISPFGTPSVWREPNYCKKPVVCPAQARVYRWS